MSKPIDFLKDAPVNESYKTTPESPMNWLVFIVGLKSGKKNRQYVRIHPDYIFSHNGSPRYFDEESLDDFRKAWMYLADESLEVTPQISSFITFIVNKLSHLFLQPRGVVIDFIANEELILLDSYITNN